MADRAYAATRKGLFELQRRGDTWRIARESFLGEPVSMLLAPQADGFMLAALKDIENLLKASSVARAQIEAEVKEDELLQQQQLDNFA